MLDHVGVSVTDITRSRAFYTAALKPLGIGILMEVPAGVTESGGAAIGLGRDGKAFFWIGDSEHVGQGTHIAFTAPDRATVDAFHAAALAAGGVDHGAPGLRPHYHADYYGAFMLDPDGHNVEAVCHGPA